MDERNVEQSVSRRASTRASFLLAAALLVAGPARANLIQDGGFETPLVPIGGYTLYPAGGTFGPWTVDCPSCTGSSDVAIVSTTFTQTGFQFVAQSGNQWLDLTGNTNQRIEVSQTIPTVVGTTYQLSFYVGNIVDRTGTFGTTSDVGVSISIPHALSLIHPYTNSNPSTGGVQNWELFTTTFIGLSDFTTISFYNFDPSSDNSNGLDGVDVEAIGNGTTVPEPASLALVAIGLVGACALRRSRRSSVYVGNAVSN